MPPKWRGVAQELAGQVLTWLERASDHGLDMM